MSAQPLRSPITVPTITIAILSTPRPRSNRTVHAEFAYLTSTHSRPTIDENQAYEGIACGL
ncbi:hypothetical protein ACKS0A_07354 [Histoplasma ohiense]